MPSPPTSLSFTVRRQKPELVAPAIPTPHELKQLSDIDDQAGLRFQLPGIQIYHSDPSMQGKDPVDVIRKALSKALVFYYPFAGRLREGANKKLMVDCTGEGVMFVEADADVSLQQFGDNLKPPFPLMEELLYQVPGSGELLHCPLLLIQVTRLKCGGFIFGILVNHTMADGTGAALFMSAIGEIARGAEVPSIKPVWCRELLSARDPPRVTCRHPEYEEEVLGDSEDTIIPLFPTDQIHRSFFFGPSEISAIRNYIPSHVGKCSTFEILSSSLWRCRTIALRLDPEEKVRLTCIVNARGKFNPPLPVGYYGNGLAFSMASTTVKELSEKPLEYAIDLVKKAKANVTEEYMRSVADLMVIKGRPYITMVGSYVVSDVTRVGLVDIDFGWGKPAYGGPATGSVGAGPGTGSFFIASKNEGGETGVAISICLPAIAMKRFVLEMEKLMKGPKHHPYAEIHL